MFYYLRFLTVGLCLLTGSSAQPRTPTPGQGSKRIDEGKSSDISKEVVLEDYYQRSNETVTLEPPDKSFDEENATHEARDSQSFSPVENGTSVDDTLNGTKDGVIEFGPVATDDDSSSQSSEGSNDRQYSDNDLYENERALEDIPDLRDILKLRDMDSPIYADSDGHQSPPLQKYVPGRYYSFLGRDGAKDNKDQENDKGYVSGKSPDLEREASMHGNMKNEDLEDGNEPDQNGEQGATDTTETTQVTQKMSGGVEFGHNTMSSSDGNEVTPPMTDIDHEANVTSGAYDWTETKGRDDDEDDDDEKNMPLYYVPYVPFNQ